jgi:hypothetical protein
VNETKGPQSLRDKRKTCAHPCAIDIKSAVKDVSYRYCLLCGERERRRTSERDMPHYKILAASKIVRTELCLNQEDFERMIEIYDERLFSRGFFAEFDAQGRWTGEKDLKGVRGED